MRRVLARCGIGVVSVALALTGCDSEPGGGTPSNSLVPDTGGGGDIIWPEAGGEPDAPAPGPDTPTPEPDAGGGDPGTDPDPDEGPSPPDVVVPVDEGPPPDTQGGPTELAGGVLLSEIDSEFLNVSGAGARFTDPQPDPPGTTFGACVVSAYDPNAQAAPPFGYDAGPITVSGTTPQLLLTPQSEGAKGTGYASGLSEEHQDLLPSGGALITIKGQGGAHIGAFTMVVQAPEPVAVTAPAVGLGATASTGSALSVSWVAGTGESIAISLSPLGGDYQPTTGQAAVCTFEGDTGAATLPADALAMVRGSSSAQNVALGVTRVRTGDTTVDGLTVTATATRSTGNLLQLVP